MSDACDVTESSSNSGTPQNFSHTLVVDMDGTLLRSDTLHEALLGLIATRPTDLFFLVSWLRQGKREFKRQVADRHVLSAEYLPYDEDVVALLCQARAEGRSTALVSAADHRQVSAVAAHLDLFDIVIGTGSAEADDSNLSGAAKARVLTERLGERNFDYIGDCATDLPVWQVAHQAMAVRPSAALIERAKAQGTQLIPIGVSSGSSWRSYLKALRPHQWSKNLLILLPVLASHDVSSLGTALIAMVAFSLIASCVYILNDLIDLPADRAHPRKKNRPFASGQVSASHGLVLAAVLAVCALVLSVLFTSSAFLGVLAGYFTVTFAYSFWLKRKLLVDIITLAGLYTTRVFAGAAATGIVLSPWLLVFSMFMFFSLAAIKRQGELVDMARRGKTSSAGRGYLTDDLPVVQGMGIAAGQAAVLVFALYINSPTTQILYSWPELMWLVCAVLFYWLSRLAMMTHRGFMDDDPIVFAIRDRVSQLCLLAIVLIVSVAVFGG